LRNLQQKLTSLLFILLGLTPLLFILVISVKKQEIRHRMEEDMDRGQLQTVVIPEQEVIWMDKHEIWVNQSMFDIRSKKLENGVYTFTGMYDREETLLVLQEKKAAGQTNEDNKLLSQFFKSLPEFCVAHEETFDPAALNDPYKNYLTFAPADPFREIITPPPQG
jgi:hypothetical protein